MIKYTDELIDYLIKNHKGKSTIQLCEEMNHIFNTNISTDSLQNLKSRLKKKGYVFEKAINTGCYKKGTIPFNKGKKGLTRANKTSFKKGNIPVNYRKIGSERVNVDGYVEIKVGEPNKWELKHRVLYRRYYGDMPKSYIVIFKDGNKFNFNKSNLVVISKKENLILNKNKLRFTNSKLTESGILIAKVVDKINEKSK